MTDRLSDLQAETKGLVPEKEHDGYADWLVEKIIGHFDVPNGQKVANSCRGLPVMAAFAGFLFQKDRTQFDLQFGNLASTKDFNGWSSIRLKAIEDRFPGQPVQSLLAELAVRLPMPKTEVIAFRSDTDVKRDIFEILKADRWIEPEGEAYSAAHDVLSDAILARHLFAMPGAEQDRVHDIAAAALKEDRLDRCIAALDRLGEHPSFQRLSGKALVEALIVSDSEKTLAVLPSLIKSRLIGPAELIALLASSDVMRTRLAEAPEAHLTMARAGEWVATKGQYEIERETAELALSAPLGSAVAFQHPSNMVLRCAYAFDSARFYDDVIERVLAAPVALDTHYLIVSLLKWGTPPADVSPHLLPWLAKNSAAPKASFVYKAWLDAGGEVQAVRDKLLLWVEEHGTSPEADFVFKAWLDAELPYEEIQLHCEAWFLVNWKLESAVFVSKALSSRSDLPLDVVARIVAWAGLYAQHEDAIFRLSRVSRVFSERMIPRCLMEILNKSLLAVFESLLYKCKFSEGEIFSCAILFGNLSKAKNFMNSIWSSVLIIYCSCLRNGKILRSFQGMPSGTWVILLHDAMKEGLLDPNRDFIAINHGHKLVQELVTAEDYANLIKHNYLLLPESSP
ncbi:MAG: hypothetical protein AAF292_17850 [Pseudomonadota bacterium]